MKLVEEHDVFANMSRECSSYFRQTIYCDDKTIMTDLEFTEAIGIIILHSR